jgi:hypothetical protein
MYRSHGSDRAEIRGASSLSKAACAPKILGEFMAERFKPKYIMWHDSDFYSSPRVARTLDWLERHLYRALCIQAMFCNTRPYLPPADSELALLADCPVDIWMQHKENVLSMFVEYTGDEGEVLGWSHRRILEDWKKYEKSQKQYKKLSRAGVDARRNSTVTARSQGGDRKMTNRTDTEQNTTPQNITKTTTTTGGEEVSDTDTQKQKRASVGARSQTVVAPPPSSDDLDGLAGQGSAQVEHGGGSEGDARLLVSQWREYSEGKLWHEARALGERSTKDESIMHTLILAYGSQRVERVMHWMLGKSTYWGRTGLGALRGIEGFSHGFDEIAKQFDKYMETARERKSGKQTFREAM